MSDGSIWGWKSEQVEWLNCVEMVDFGDLSRPKRKRLDLKFRLSLD